MAEVINKLENENLLRVTVLTPAGAVGGVIDRGDIIQTLVNKLGLRISDLEIKRIKQEGSYPPGLQLGIIAKSIN
jgi:hypothetical protein